MAAELDGRVALVTGGSRGLGRAIATALGRAGARVALVARSPAALEEASAGIPGSQPFPADVGDPAAVTAMVAQVGSELGPPAILVNAAGVFGPIALLPDTDPQAWIDTQRVNVVGPYLTCRAVLPAMLAARWGRIVNVTSAAALHPPGPLNSAYGTSKVALNQLTRHLAAEIEGSGVTANVLHPGDVKTEMWADIREQCAALGERGGAYRQWVEWVEETGGDPPEKAAARVVEIATDAGGAPNGRFLWVREPLQAPIRSWGDEDESEAVEAQPWR